MPTNGMLTLRDAVSDYQDGVAWKQQQDQIVREKKLQDGHDAANQAASGVIDASKAEWAMGGAKGDYRPSDETMMKAAEARGMAFAKTGDWESFFKNEGSVQGQRMRVRQNAFERYNEDGDVTALAKTIGPTVFSGKNITGTEMLPGGENGAPLGAPSGPAKMRLTYDDGTAKLVDPTEFVNKLKLTLTDPAKTAEMDAKLSYFAAQERIRNEGRKGVEREKGAEARLTEGVKGKNQIGLAESKFGYDQELHGMDNTSHEKVGAGNNSATRYAADVAGDTRVEAAGLRGAGGGGKASTGLLKTASDADGNVVLYFRDGTQRKAVDPDSGKPLKSGEWGKRIDSLAKTLADSPGNHGKTPTELRAIAAETLGSSAAKPKPAGPGLGSFNGAGGKPPLSDFMTK